MNPLIPIIKDKNGNIVNVNDLVQCEERVFKIVHIQNVFMVSDYIHSYISVFSLSIDKPVNIMLQHVRNSYGTFVLIDGHGREWSIFTSFSQKAV